ncbi:hypothetical protein [Streptomyces sp. CNQ085]|uniref:hypothetical protein n=1 Tax=Streptomyces sp. CNQ085 TaxID=2886944 RepID=UPI001F512B1D|nr:hypothetical protein [Streptomyces sp. CNQ085]MCI0383435.1 hypothetical protein [Streptomyces sp. CNQ085]
MPDTVTVPPAISTPHAPGARRRVPPRVLAVWFAVLTMLAGLFVTAADPGEARAHGRGPAITGAWEVAVTVGTGPDATTAVSRFVFHENRTVTTDGTPDENGVPQYPGTGYWVAREGNAFSFYVTHPGPSEPAEGVFPGTVHAVHLGRVSGRGFTTTATAFTVLEQDGTVFGPVTVSARGTRLG